MSDLLAASFHFLGINDAAKRRQLTGILQQAGILDAARAAARPPAFAAPVNPPLLMLDPAAIKSDPDTYQFRAGGDKNGVTMHGRFAAARWDPILHGDPLLVHERLSGEMFVADGHHRLELANRLNAEGKGPGRVAAMVLREADGYTPLDVKIIAAYKNMQHGQTDPVDAARVFKAVAEGKVHRELLPSLQMDKGNLRLSYTLSKLSDASLAHVASGEIPPEVAAQVVQRVPGEANRDAVVGMVTAKLRQRRAEPPGISR